MAEAFPKIEVGTLNCGGTVWVRANDERASPSWLTPKEAMDLGTKLVKFYGKNFADDAPLQSAFSVGYAKVEERKIGDQFYVAVRARGHDWSVFDLNKAAVFGARLVTQGQAALKAERLQQPKNNYQELKFG